MLPRLTAFLLALAAPLAAQDQAPRPVEFTGDIGFVNTAGNTDVTTLNVGEKISYNLTRFTLKQFFAVVYGSSQGQTTTSLWRGGLRGDYSLAPAVAIFGSAGYDRNRFAGVSRRVEEGIGVAIKAVNRDRDKLQFEGGLTLTQQHSTLGVDDNFSSARSAVTYQHNFTETAYFLQTVEVLPNLETSEDLRINAETGFVAPISKQVAIKLAYVIRYDKLPEPGFKKTDRLFTSGLQISL